MEGRRRGIAEQQERIASSQSGQAGLSSPKKISTDELSRLKGRASDALRRACREKDRARQPLKGIDAKRVDAMAEEKGAEGTLKVGKGPQLSRAGRRAWPHERCLQDPGGARSRRRHAARPDRHAQSLRSSASWLPSTATSLSSRARYRPRKAASRSPRQTRMARRGQKSTRPASARPSSAPAPSFARTRPSSGSAHAAASVRQLQGADANPRQQGRVRGIDCDPKQANEAASRVFALNSGLDAFPAKPARAATSCPRPAHRRPPLVRPQVPAGQRPAEQGF